MNEISQEQAQEYREVAALLAGDIEVIKDVSESEGLTKADLKGQIDLLHEYMRDMIDNPEVRKRRYGAGCLINSFVKPR